MVGLTQNVPHEYIEGNHFGVEADAIGLTPEVRDEVLRGFLFVISRTPSDFLHIQFPNIYRGVHRLKDGRQVRIWFTFDDSIITLQGIDLYE